MRDHPVTAPWLSHWLKVTAAGKWNNLQEVRATFPHADGVLVKSGRTATIFNVGRTGFRLVTAIHYRSKIVFTVRLLTHAEYEKGKWVKAL